VLAALIDAARLLDDPMLLAGWRYLPLG